MNELLDHHKPLDDYGADLTVRQGAVAAQSGAINHSVYDQKYGTPGFTNTPYCMYFYYVRINDDGRLEIAHYFYPNGLVGKPETWQPIQYDRTILGDLVLKLAKNARPSGAHWWKDGQKFEGVTWDRKSYIAIFVDELNWKLHTFSNADPGIVFITEPKDGKVGMPNYSFFDALDLDIHIPDEPGTRSAVVFINHMKGDEDGNDIGKYVRQFFQFKMFFDVKFADGANGMTMILDPGGDNLGPPNPPPPPL